MDFSDGFLLLRKQKIIHLGCNPSKLKLCILPAGFPLLQKRKKIHQSPKSSENIDGFRDPSERKQAPRFPGVLQMFLILGFWSTF